MRLFAPKERLADETRAALDPAAVKKLTGLGIQVSIESSEELGELLESKGAEVRYAIHPVAGRMPGHMNVLLAEADVPYEQLMEMDAINPTMSQVDLAIVIGANDVVNPAAIDEPKSPNAKQTITALTAQFKG